MSSRERDAIGDLFASPQPKGTSSGGVGGLIVGVLLIAVVSYFAISKLPNDGNNRDRDDQHGQKDEEQEKDNGKDQHSAAGCVVVFVLELQTKSADQELVLRSMSDTVVTRQLSGFRVFDDDSKDAEPFVSFAKSKGKEAPLMCLIKNKQIIRLESFPETVSYQAVEAFLQ